MYWSLTKISGSSSGWMEWLDICSQAYRFFFKVCNESSMFN